MRASRIAIAALTLATLGVAILFAVDSSPSLFDRTTEAAENTKTPVPLPQSPERVKSHPRDSSVPQEPMRDEPVTYLLPIDDFNTVIVKDKCDFRGYLLPKGETVSANYKLVSLVDYPLNYTTRLYMQPADEPPLIGVQGRFEPSAFVLKPRDSQILTLTLTAAKEAKDAQARIAPDTFWKMVNGSGRAGGFGFQVFIAVGEGKSFPIDYFYSMKLLDDGRAIEKKAILGVFPRGEEATVTMKAGETREVKWKMKISYAKGDPIELNPTARVLSVNQQDNSRLPEGVAFNFTTSTPKIVQNEDFEFILKISVGKSVQPTDMRILVTLFGPPKSPLAGNIGACREEPFHSLLDIRIEN